MKSTKINLNLYKTFVEVYETKNLSAAAHNLGLTQPTITYNVKELERQLKTRLFNSNSRGVEPTPNADELYPLVRAAFTYLINVEDTLREFNEKSSGTIHITISLFFTSNVVANFITTFSKQYPNVKFKITTAPKCEALSALHKHETDIVVLAHIPNKEIKQDMFNTISLAMLDLCLFTSKDFAKKHGLETTITTEQLSTLPVISQPKPFLIGHILEQLGASNLAIETNTTEMVIHLVEKDLGIALGPSELVTQNKNFIKLELANGEFPKYQLAIKTNENLANKAAIAFISQFKDKL